MTIRKTDEPYHHNRCYQPVHYVNTLIMSFVFDSGGHSGAGTEKGGECFQWKN